MSRDGVWQDWLIFFLRGVVAQARDGVTRSERLQDLREQHRQQVQAERAAARLLQAVDLLFARPVLTVRQVETALDVHFSTAQRYVNQLEEAGLLREITGQARNRVYCADEILRMLEEPLSLDQETGQ